MKKHFYTIVLMVVVTATMLSSCKKDPLITDSSAKLEFSADTVMFDTVFTTIGSSTRFLLVYNEHKRKINISSIRLGNGISSKFRINVDGVSGRYFENIEIPANDSIFIFVEVTVDPNNANSPMIISDSILFETNGNLQNVKLVAWGQDAHYHFPLRGSIFDTISTNEVWTNDKPHVIYGYVLVDSLKTLTISEGTKVHIHKWSGMLVYREGSLKINGTKDNPVIIQGDRLEAPYREIPGQWDRIWLSAQSVNNEINYAIIKNGTIGLQVDTVGHPVNPTLKISNSIIRNMEAACLYAQGARIEAFNCVFSNSGQYAALLSIGGEYRFRHCTFANYWVFGNRQTPAILLNNYYKDYNGNIQVRPLHEAYFGNCIVYGNLQNEIGFDQKAGNTFNYKFENCLLKIDPAVNTNDAVYFSAIVKNLTSDSNLFENVSDNNYELKDNSPAIDIGSSSITLQNPPITLDLKGSARISGAAPDAGAYEK